jgi:hypothetical protein
MKLLLGFAGVLVMFLGALVGLSYNPIDQNAYPIIMMLGFAMLLFAMFGLRSVD